MPRRTRRSFATKNTKITKQRQSQTFLIFVTFVFFVAFHFVSFVAQAPPARRIISLVPALTEILFAIGAGPQVIAVSSFDDDPPEVLKLPRVGALLDPDTERILSMRPDLVLTYGSQTALETQLETAGIRAVSYRHGDLANLAPTFRMVGDLAGHRPEADRAIAEIERRFASIRAKVAGRGRPKVMLVFGHEPGTLRNIDASGGYGFLHDILELTGGQNVFADIKRQAVHVSTEMLIVRAPDVILDLHYSREMNDTQRREDLEAWRRVVSVPAVKSNRVLLMFGDHLVVPGPRIGGAAEEYARAIHPEAFK